MEPGIPSRIPSIRPIHINRMTKNATAAHTYAPSPKQSTRDWIRIPGEIGWARPVRHPARLAISTAHGCSRGAIWAHIQIMCRNLKWTPVPKNLKWDH